MAFEWDEAGARKRLADYDAALDAIAEELQDGGEPREFNLRELREKLAEWCWHDGKRAFAEIDRLRAALERVASGLSFTGPEVTEDRNGKELAARIRFAREALKP